LHFKVLLVKQYLQVGIGHIKRHVFLYLRYLVLCRYYGKVCPACTVKVLQAVINIYTHIEAQGCKLCGLVFQQTCSDVLVKPHIPGMGTLSVCSRQKSTPGITSGNYGCFLIKFSKL